MAENRLEKISISLGFAGLYDLLLKLVFPIVLTSFFLTSIVILISKSISAGVIVFALGNLMSIIIPFIIYARKQHDIKTHLHYFITYAGTISTMKISRHILFKRVAEKRQFGEISMLFEKIIYLAKHWNLGFSVACKAIGNRTPSRILADFFDRTAVIMDFGEDIEQYLEQEQKAVLHDFSIDYQKSLESIKMVQETFISLSISFSFMLGILLLSPLMVDMPIDAVLKGSLFGLALMYGMIVLAIIYFITPDNMFHNLKQKSVEQMRIRIWFYFMSGLSLFILIILHFGTDWQLMFQLSVASLPLVFPAVKASQEEEKVKQKDQSYPVLIRTLGAAIEVKKGGTISGLQSIRMHDFGVLNDMIKALYRRLRVGSDKFRCWYLLGVESSSNIIHNFSKIFVESVNLGGNAEKIGQIISANVLHLLSLRKMRWQLASTMKGAYYGALIGIVSTIFITARISEIMSRIMRPGEDVNPEIMAYISGIFPHQVPDFSNAYIYLTYMVLVHILMSVISLKLISGRSFYGVFIDLILMLWIAAIIIWSTPYLVDKLMPNINIMAITAG